MELKIQDIQANYEQILQIVGKQSYVNWEAFTKNSTELIRNMEDLAKTISIYRDIHQKKFITTMKKLKGSDIPDLIKTVKSKKLPRQALKTILNKFKINSQGNIELIGSVEQLKNNSKQIYSQYINTNEQLITKLHESLEVVSQKIRESGLYEQTAQPKELVSTFQHHFVEETLEKIKKNIIIQLQPGTENLINIKTYGQIVEATFDIVKDQYQRLTIQTRNQQRKVINNSAKYTEVIVDYLTNTEVLIIDGQKAIVDKLRIGIKKMEESEIFLMQKGLAQTIFLIQSNLRSKVKESFGASKQVSLDTIKQIIKFQGQTVKSKGPFLREVIGSLEKTAQNFQIIPLIIALTLNDFVFEKYGLQEQDFMKGVTDQMLLSHPEVANMFKQMESAIINLMKQAGVINEDMAKVIEMQSRQIQSQVAQMTNSNVTNSPNGVLPGSNPLQLLQYRLNQQLNQVDPKK